MDYVPLTPVTSACIVAASNHYQVQPALLLSVLKVESGQVGKVSRNDNGTVDIGPMQVNSIHLPELEKFGILFEQLKNDGCLNVHVGAYYIKKAELAQTGGAVQTSAKEFWKGVGNYHSKTPQYNTRYAAKVAAAVNALPPEWRNFDCRKYNVCGATLKDMQNVAEAQPQTQNTQRSFAEAQAQPNPTQSVQALTPYKKR
jgi:soluble lytic murein transglycosylase-like protein